MAVTKKTLNEIQIIEEYTIKLILDSEGFYWLGTDNDEINAKITIFVEQVKASVNV